MNPDDCTGLQTWPNRLFAKHSGHIHYVRIIVEFALSDAVIELPECALTAKVLGIQIPVDAYG